MSHSGLWDHFDARLSGCHAEKRRISLLYVTVVYTLAICCLSEDFTSRPRDSKLTFLARVVTAVSFTAADRQINKQQST